MASQPNDPPLFYQTHIICCTNDREPDDPRGSCKARGAVDLASHVRTRAKELGVENSRVQQSNCLDRCELGPTMVIYPEGVWYSYHNTDDIEEILQTHVLGGGRVLRLMLNPDEKLPEDRKQNNPEPAAE